MINWKDEVVVKISYAQYEGLRDLKRFVNGALSCSEKETALHETLSNIEFQLGHHYNSIICEAREKFGLPE